MFSAAQMHSSVGPAPDTGGPLRHSGTKELLNASWNSGVRDLKEKTIRGGAARLVGYTARSLVRLGALIILAHLLDPTDFGLVAMVTVFTGVFEVFATGGLSTATVQRAEVSDAQISTLFWFNVAIGALLALLCLAAAPVISRFFNDPRTALIIISVAPAFIVNATGVQHLALLQRELRYLTLAAIEVGSEIVAAAIAISMAVAGFGYWAIVASVFTCPLVVTIGAWAASGWIPGRPRGIRDVSTMLLFGGTITLNSLVVFAAYNLEKVLLGRYFGANALGLYGRAYELINLPTRTHQQCDRGRRLLVACAIAGRARPPQKLLLEGLFPYRFHHAPRNNCVCRFC